MYPPDFMELSSIDITLQTLPDSPGIYQFYDKNNTILYVGKARNLKKRVSSYFQKQHESGKTRLLVKKIARIEHIVVATESDALLLENNLIKKIPTTIQYFVKKTTKVTRGYVSRKNVSREFSKPDA
ncbi:hypothetical protein CCAN11_2470062 [Capnocytophaga canimorsus]|uniref:GIY-YIG domain-containing protein n=1 Tax=Capnocytophaga canimorsus TaxID=28188 RepID=A0A0B7IRB2_9FLAO|nr:hypothetical protein CCAN11_2470062 [Capnocytophaga canimorsus]